MDLWVVKLSETGELLWQKTYGGMNDDIGSAIKQTPDGGYIVVGETASPDGDVSGNQGNVDVWVLKLDSVGTLEWQKALGGNNADFGSGVVLMDDGGYVISAFVGSHNTGDITGHNELGSLDVWIVRLDSQGNIIWQKTAGGANPDYAREIIKTPDGSFVIAGGTQSTNGDVSGNHGQGDFWLLKFSDSGDLLWQKTYGGTLHDQGFSVANTTDGGYVMCGYSWSVDEDVIGSNNLGKNDYWIVKLHPEGVSATSDPGDQGQSLQIYPNPATQEVFISFSDEAGDILVSLHDMMGREQLHRKIPNNTWLNIQSIAPGLYQLGIQTPGGYQYFETLQKL